MGTVRTIDIGGGSAISTAVMHLKAHAAHSKGDCTAVSFAAFHATTGLPYLTKAVASIEFDVIVVALDDVAINQVGRYAVSGVVDCLVDSGVAAGEILAATAAAEDLQDATSVTNAKILGRALEAYSASALSKVWFDGLNGIGHNEA